MKKYYTIHPSRNAQSRTNLTKKFYLCTMFGENNKLNLPECRLDIRSRNDGNREVFDILRRKFVALTPEEWVRQHFVHMLTEQNGYPAALMANEVGITLNGTTRRCDTIVYDHDCRPIMIIEYKAPGVEITQKVFDQAVRYNMVLKVKYLVISNGISHYVCAIDYTSHRYSFLKEIPTYGNL